MCLNVFVIASVHWRTENSMQIFKVRQLFTLGKINMQERKCNHRA